jgi:Ca2+/H+ antiporter, TMEM165/GDT1 family
MASIRHPVPRVSVWLTAFLTTTGLVAVAEIGDKTQLLSLLLAARFRKPWTILTAILLATIANHLLAAWLGLGLERWLTPVVLRWVLGVSFLAMAVWTLIPDRLEDETAAPSTWGAFVTTLVAFFIAEIGDKTQLATAALAARYAAVMLVTAASTLGLLLANAPVVFMGERLMRKLPLNRMRRLAAGAFAILGFVTLIGW